MTDNNHRLYAGGVWLGTVHALCMRRGEGPVAGDAAGRVLQAVLQALYQSLVIAAEVYTVPVPVAGRVAGPVGGGAAQALLQVQGRPALAKAPVLATWLSVLGSASCRRQIRALHQLLATREE